MSRYCEPLFRSSRRRTDDDRFIENGALRKYRTGREPLPGTSLMKFVRLQSLMINFKLGDVLFKSEILRKAYDTAETVVQRSFPNEPTRKSVCLLFFLSICTFFSLQNINIQFFLYEAFGHAISCPMFISL